MENLSEEYLISGMGFTAFFKTLEDRNSFKEKVDTIYIEMSKDSKFTNKTVLHTSISIVLAKAMHVKFEQFNNLNDAIIFRTI